MSYPAERLLDIALLQNEGACVAGDEPLKVGGRHLPAASDRKGNHN